MKFSLIISFIFVLFSCKDGTIEHDSSKPKAILLKNEIKNVNLSEIITDINYIPLETIKESLVGEIIKIKIYENIIYILNQAGENSNIKIFSFSGKYLGDIGRIGNGPEEIQKPRDFVINNDIIFVWDNIGIHSFTKTGNYLKFLFEAHFVGRTFFYNDNSFFFLHELNPPGFLTKYDIKGNLKKVFIPSDIWLGAFEHSKIIELESNYTIFSPTFDTIYTYLENNLLPKYVIQCNEAKSMGKLFLENKDLNPYELSKVINTTPSFDITCYNENERFIYINYTIDKRNNTLLINKESLDYQYSTHFINDIDDGIFGNARFITKDDKLIIPLNSFDILEHIKKNQASIKKNSPLRIVSKNLRLTSNPVLMICKIKD